MLYVSYASCPNVDVINDQSFVAEDVLDPNGLPAGVELAELRGLCFAPDGLLWVVSGRKTVNQVLRFEGQPRADGLHHFVDAALTQHDLNSIAHPFDIAFNPTTGHWFVSNQDTNVVTGPLHEPPPPYDKSAARYLVENYPLPFADRTFVDSAVCAPGLPPAVTLVPAPQGLEGEFNHTRHSVRGLAHDGTYLYVADEQAGKVKAYDSSGKLVWRFPEGASLQDPVHLLLTGDGLYIGTGGTDPYGGLVTYVKPLGSDSHIVAMQIDQLSGMTIDDQKTLYVASRRQQQAYTAGQVQGTMDAGGMPPPTPYGPKLRDEPEFIVWRPDRPWPSA